MLNNKKSKKIKLERVFTLFYEATLDLMFRCSQLIQDPILLWVSFRRNAMRKEGGDEWKTYLGRKLPVPVQMSVVRKRLFWDVNFRFQPKCPPCENGYFGLRLREGIV